VLGLDPVIAVGYSMGGPVAQLMWRRHPERVRGLVLCATSAHFRTSREERLGFLGLTGLAAVARLTPAQARRWLIDHFYLKGKAATWEPWALQQAAQHEWRTVLEAGRAIGGFDARPWIGSVDVPTAAVITMRDTVVPVRRQIRLFQSIPDCEAYRVDGDHDAVISMPAFGPLLARACASVAERSR
jgi:3-oxoadipate enol-lactonase